MAHYISTKDGGKRIPISWPEVRQISLEAEQQSTVTRDAIQSNPARLARAIPRLVSTDELVGSPASAGR